MDELQRTSTASNVIALETPEHEVIELEGCSKAELDAKLHDFYAWAS